MVLERATEESGEFGVVEYLLRSLLALAKVYKEWHMWTNKPCCVSPSEKRRHESAEACDICGGSFTDSNRKVAHHEHGTGRWLASACNSCNLGIKLPTAIPIYYRNGSGYDFKYILRFLAHEKGSFDHQAFLDNLIRKNQGEDDEESNEEVEAEEGERPEHADPWAAICRR